MGNRAKKRLIILLLAAFVILCTFVWINIHLLTEKPFAESREFNGPSGVFSGPSGRTYIIDEGKKSILVLNSASQLELVIKTSSQGFYYASLIAEGSDGSIYVADALYSGQGTILKAERLFRYDSNGKNPKLMYEIDYTDSLNPPMQYGRIKSLTEIDGHLVFAVQASAGVEVCQLDLKTNTVNSKIYDLGGLYLAQVDIMPDTLLPVFTTMPGQICAVNKNGEVEILVESRKDRTPWWISAVPGRVLYTDLAGKQVIELDLDTLEECPILQGDETVYTVSHDSYERVYSCDFIGYYIVENGEITYRDAVPIYNSVLRNATWLVLILAVIVACGILYVILLPVLKKKKSATFQRMVIVLTVSLSVSALVTYTTLDKTINIQSDSISDNLNLFGDTLIAATDVEKLKNIKYVTDYMSDDFVSVRTALDEITEFSYDSGLCYYYLIYVTDGDRFYGVMDYEDTMTTRHPLYNYGDEGYTEALFGETVSVAWELSSFGLWSFVLKPVYDSSGEVVAILEVGVNLDDLNAQTQALVIEVILTVAAATVVLLMIIIEAIFLFEHFESSRGAIKPDIGFSSSFPLRTLIFITYLADCLQDAFISIYASKLYEPFWGIPRSIGAALPISAQVLTAAMFAFAGGWLIRVLGAKKVLAAGYSFQLAGFMVCAIFPSYFGLFAGKAIMGIGMGLIIVSINTLSASIQDDMERAGVFSATNAGMLAGVTAGSGIGSVVLSLGSFSTIFYSGAIIVMFGLILTLVCKGGEVSSVEKEEKKISIFKFIWNREVLSFLLLILMPFLIANSYRDYFFPIFASDNGLSEAYIGRIYLICGLVVIYAGPFLNNTLLSRYGGKWTVVIGSTLMYMSILVFAVIPALPSAIAGLTLLSVAISFAFAAQSTYFSSMNNVAVYGESKAMGVYSLFENGGLTLGPILYGLAMLSGTHAGLIGIGISIAIFMILFIILNLKNKTETT